MLNVNDFFYLQWEAKVERCQEEFNAISKMIKKEMETFEVARVKDFKAVIVKYLEEQMAHQQQVCRFKTNTHTKCKMSSCHTGHNSV